MSKVDDSDAQRESSEVVQEQGRVDDAGDVAVESASASIATTVPATRASRLWISIPPALLILAILLIFVFQNLHNATINFLGFSGDFPLSVLVLVSAAIGGVLVLLLGSIRIIQLRRMVRRTRRSELRR